MYDPFSPDFPPAPPNGTEQPTEPKDRSKHARHIRDARAILDDLTPYQRGVVQRICLSSEMSRATNRRANKEYRAALARVKELEAELAARGISYD